MAVSSRVHTILLVSILVVGIAIAGMLASRALGGPLDPPGPVGSTDGVRAPGTPISALPFVITTPGRYYLTRSLTGQAATTGVSIQSSGVTLDLGGFELTGTGGTGIGILVQGSWQRISIVNGTVRGWFDGINADTAVYSQIDHVNIVGNGQSFSDGSVALRIGIVSTVSNCGIDGNKDRGAGALVSVTVDRCRIVDNGSSGIGVAGRTYVHDSYITNNNVGQGGAYDLVMSGSNNVVVDNYLGRLFANGGAPPNAFQRNSYCFADPGPLTVFPTGASAEANVQIC